MVQHCSWSWVVEIVSILLDKLRFDFGIAHDVSDFGVGHFWNRISGLSDLSILSIKKCLFLSISNSISVHNYSDWVVTLTGFCKCLKSVNEHWLKLITEFTLCLFYPGEISVALLVHCAN